MEAWVASGRDILACAELPAFVDAVDVPVSKHLDDTGNDLGLQVPNHLR